MAEAGRDVRRRGAQGRAQARDEIFHRDHRAVHREVDRRDGDRRLRPRTGAAIERRPYASSSLLIAKPSSRTRFSSSTKAARDGQRVRAAAREVDRGRAPPSGRPPSRNASSTLPSDVQYAGRREPTWRLRSISRCPVPRAAAALDVDDVEAVEDRHVHRVAGLVAELPQVRRRDLAQLHRVDRREAEVEHARTEAVLLRRRDPAGDSRARRAWRRSGASCCG